MRESWLKVWKEAKDPKTDQYNFSKPEVLTLSVQNFEILNWLSFLIIKEVIKDDDIL